MESITTSPIFRESATERGTVMYLELEVVPTTVLKELMTAFTLSPTVMEAATEGVTVTVDVPLTVSTVVETVETIEATVAQTLMVDAR